MNDNLRASLEAVYGANTIMEFHNVLSGPLSAKASFKLYYSGPYRSREIRHLIKQLELVKTWLEEEEAEDAANELQQREQSGSPSIPSGPEVGADAPEAPPHAEAPEGTVGKEAGAGKGVSHAA
jgi:hypothetical protein